MRYYLIGFTGCGKTTLGKKVAKSVNINFIDLDKLIVEKTKMSIPEIFEKYGERYFRDVESNVLEDVQDNNIIISTGGGIIHQESNINFMKQSGKIIYIETELIDILHNLSQKEIESRPMLSMPFDKIKNLYATRKIIYNQICDYKISNLNIDESLLKIKGFIKK